MASLVKIKSKEFVGRSVMLGDSKFKEVSFDQDGFAEIEKKHYDLLVSLEFPEEWVKKVEEPLLPQSTK